MGCACIFDEIKVSKLIFKLLTIFVEPRRWRSKVIAVEEFIDDVSPKSGAERIVGAFLCRPLDFMSVKVVYKHPVQFLFLVWHHRDEVLIHGRAEALLVLVWRYDCRVLI